MNIQLDDLLILAFAFGLIAVGIAGRVYEQRRYLRAWSVRLERVQRKNT